MKLGYTTPAGHSFDLPDSVFDDHVLIVGKTKSGKGVLVSEIVASLLETSIDSLILFVDLGGDQAQYHRDTAQATSLMRPVKWLSSRNIHFPGSSRINPFQSLTTQKIQPVQASGLLVHASGISSSKEYGAWYYFGRNMAITQDIVAKLHNENLPVTLPTIRDRLNDLGANSSRDAEQIIDQVRILLSYDALQVSKNTPPEELIDWNTLIDERAFVYDYNPTINETQSTVMASFVVNSLINVAIERYEHGLPPKRIYIVIDEWQTMLSAHAAQLLAQCRKFGITLILLNQTFHQLRSVSLSLCGDVLANTSLQILFTPDELETEWIQLHGLDVQKEQKSNTRNPANFNTTTTTRINDDSEIERNDLVRGAHSVAQAYFVFTGKNAHRSPERVQLQYSVPKETWDFLARLPLPTRPKEPQLIDKPKRPMKSENQLRLKAIWDSRKP